jgi:hypothetical protein
MTYHHQTDYSRYFSLRQKATLINMSEERDADCFESLSGYVAGRSSDMIELHIPYYPIEPNQLDSTDYSVSYKLTSESLGNGIQVMTDLVKIVNGNIFQLKLRGTLELFQRRSTPRIDITVKLFKIKQELPLSSLKIEWKKVKDHLQANILPSSVFFQERPVNLCTGGISISDTQPSPVSMFILDIMDNLPPICVIAENAWQRRENEELKCGYSFIQILKSDQDRIERFVYNVMKESGAVLPTKKTNWELVDRMSI